MHLVEVFRKVKSLEEPDREADKMIAEVIGYRRRPRVAPSLSGEANRTLWVISKYDGDRNIPPFTSSMDAALELAESVCQAGAIGASWEPTTASARIGTGPYVQAPTPALALCLAALIAASQQ